MVNFIEMIEAELFRVNADDVPCGIGVRAVEDARDGDLIEIYDDQDGGVYRGQQALGALRSLPDDACQEDRDPVWDALAEIEEIKDWVKIIQIPDYERAALVDEDPYRRDTQGMCSAAVEITEDGAVSLETYSPGQGVSGLNWHGRTLSVPLLTCADAEEVVGLLRGEEGQALLRCVIGGHSSEWDGRNRVGCTTDAAADAMFKLEQLLEDVEIVGVWHAGDWLAAITNADLELTAHTTDEQIKKTAKELMAIFDQDCPTEVLFGDMAEVLRWRCSQID